MSDVYGLINEDLTMLQHSCRLDFKEPATHHRLTGIVGTISKASSDPEILRGMIMAGMNIARLNFSHDTHDFHRKTIENLRAVCEECSKDLGYTVQVAIALDTKGPEIRTGFIDVGHQTEVELRPNDNIRLSVNRDLMEKGNRECVYVDYDNIINVLVQGSVVFIDDGALKLVVKEVGMDCVTCVVERGGILGCQKKVNLPGAEVDLPAVSEKDSNDLKFGIENGIDIIFASATRSGSAIREIRSILGEKGPDVTIIAKIDYEQGLKCVDDILAAADGILFARADLAIEVPPHKVFLAQKAIAARCNRAGKPIIIATQLLESMRYNTLPTGAEITDLANTILDGADCVMLSSETALGNHPVHTVKTMCDIVHEAEVALWYRRMFDDLLAHNPETIDAVHSVAIAAVDAAERTLAAAIIVLTTSCRSAYLLAKYRPRCPILAVTHCPRAFRQSQLHRGVVPILFTEKPQKNWVDTVDARFQYAMDVARYMKLIRTGDTIILVSSWTNSTGFTNTLRVVYAYFEQDDLSCLMKGDRRSTKKLPMN